MTKAEAAMLAALQHAYQGEAIFRPSGAAGWLLPDGCTGRIQMIAKLPRIKQVSGPAAREGSAAHKLGQVCMTNTQGLTPEDFVGRSIQVEDDDPNSMHFVDDQMGDVVTDYIKIVDGYRVIPGTEIFIERKLSLKHLDPTDPLLNECRGTGDVVAINRDQRWLTVIDLKYGKGIPVSGDSPQPKIYLLMAMLEYLAVGEPWEWGSTLIYQPRLPVPPYTEDDHFKPFLYIKPANLLSDFLGLVLESMHAALAPEPLLNPSKKNCEWCEAAAICPAARAAGLDVRRGRGQQPQQPMTALSKLPPFPKIVLGTHDDPRPQERDGIIVLPAASDLDPYEISNMLHGGVMFDIWHSSVQHRASQLLTAGVPIPPTREGSPGWYLKPRTGNRRWNTTREVVEHDLLALGLKPADIYTDPKLKSPKQVEDVLPKLKKSAIESLYDRPAGTPTLVPGQPDNALTLSAKLGPILLKP